MVTMCEMGQAKLIRLFDSEPIEVAAANTQHRTAENQLLILSLPIGIGCRPLGNSTSHHVNVSCPSSE